MTLGRVILQKGKLRQRGQVIAQVTQDVESTVRPSNKGNSVGAANDTTLRFCDFSRDSFFEGSYNFQGFLNTCPKAGSQSGPRGKTSLWEGPHTFWRRGWGSPGSLGPQRQRACCPSPPAGHHVGLGQTGLRYSHFPCLSSLNLEAKPGTHVSSQGSWQAPTDCPQPTGPKGPDRAQGCAPTHAGEPSRSSEVVPVPARGGSHRKGRRGHPPTTTSESPMAGSVLHRLIA